MLGANGAGKSTLLRVISGLLPCRKGRIRFDGIDVTRMPAHRRVEIGLVQVPEGRQMLSDMTVEENLLLGGYVRRRARGAIEQSRDEVYALFPVLKDMLRRRGGDLSGGQQQQLASGRALVMRPRLLLLDEPTEGIQPSIIKDIGRALTYLRSLRNIAIILVEQYLDFARELGDYFVVMDRGQIMHHGPASDLDLAEVRRHLMV